MRGPSALLLMGDRPRTLDRLRALTLFERLRSVGVECERTDTTKLWRRLHDSPPDLLMLDSGLPQEEADDVLDALHADPLLRERPVMTLGADSDGRWNWTRIARDATLRLGLCSSMMPRPTIRTRHFGRVLILDPARRMSRQLEMKLRGVGLSVEREFVGLEGFDTAVHWKPDAILTEFMLPRASGSWVLGRLRDCGMQTPTIFLTDFEGQNFPAAKETLLDLGAAAVLPKSPTFAAVIEALATVMPLPESVFIESGATRPERVETPVAETADELLPAAAQTTAPIPQPHVPLGAFTGDTAHAGRKESRERATSE